MGVSEGQADNKQPGSSKISRTNHGKLGDCGSRRGWVNNRFETPCLRQQTGEIENDTPRPLTINCKGSLCCCVLWLGQLINGLLMYVKAKA